jgi:predicted ribosomally synthesized peptide with SipW-like signal peptide
MPSTRDREIERRATRIGIETARMGLFLALIAIVVWASFSDQDTVNKSLLTWLVFAQFAICYGVKGLVSIVTYRRHCRAP